MAPQVAFFDRANVTLSVGGGAQRILLTCYGYNDSGLNCCGLDERSNLDTLLVRLEHCFRVAGRVPDLLALKPSRPFTKPGTHDWVAPFERFCSHFNIVADSSDAGRREWLREALAWLDSRTHDTLLSCEKGLNGHLGCGRATVDLTPLPDRPFVSAHDQFRKVAADGFLLCRGDVYSVPDSYCGKTVWVQIRNGQVLICSQEGRRLALHQAGNGTGRVILNLAHFETTRYRLTRDTVALEKAFRLRFPKHDSFLSGLRAQRRQSAPATLRRLLALTAQYSTSAISAALERALAYNIFSSRFIEGLLTVKPSAPEPSSNYEQGTLFD
jgi:hypothetical protein